MRSLISKVIMIIVLSTCLYDVLPESNLYAAPTSCAQITQGSSIADANGNRHRRRWLRRHHRRCHPRHWR